MNVTKNRWAIALAAAASTTVIAGGVALASVQQPATAEVHGTVTEPVSSLVDRDQPNKLKAALDALVAKGTITQAQEDAILKALKDNVPAPGIKPAAPAGADIRSFVHDMAHTTATYLGITEKELVAQLHAGKSIADIATAKGRSTTELAALLTKNAGDKIDQAVAAKKLTADQAATLKTKIAAQVTSFLQHSFKPH